MYWKGFGRKRSWPTFKVLSRNLPQGTGKCKKPQVRVAGLRSEILIGTCRTPSVNHSTATFSGSNWNSNWSFEVEPERQNLRKRKTSSLARLKPFLRMAKGLRTVTGAVLTLTGLLSWLKALTCSNQCLLLLAGRWACQSEFVYITFTNSVRTAKKTRHLTITKISWLMLWKKIIAFYTENITPPTNTKWRVTDLKQLVHTVKNRLKVEINKQRRIN
jgi:hypothetical protein